MLVGLGLPWTSEVPGSYTSGYLSPSFCTPSYYDGTLDCTYGYYQPGLYLGGQAAAPGYATPARVFVAGALVLMVLTVRQSSRRQLVAAAVVGGSGVVLGGVGVRGGQIVLAIAVGCLVMALQRWKRSDPQYVGAT